MRSILDLSMKIKKCNLCRGLYVDKPCIIHRIYDKYLPSKPLVFVVSESPPPGFKQDYLYNNFRKDNLRIVLSRIFNIDERDVIEYLVKKHVFWSTAVKCRPLYSDRNKKNKYVEIMRRNCREILSYEINVLKPEITVALGNVALKSFREIGLKPDFQAYHPLYYRRIGDLDKLKRLFNEVFESIGLI
ncbi:MAG: uracil-DNA glycosylase family protein [Desulfurococcaceae archaeon]